MAFSAALAEQIRDALGDRPEVTEKKMFGGLAFLREGKMFCGVVGDSLMVRVGPAAYDEALGRPHVRPMDFTGRPMKGYVFVDAEGCDTIPATQDWVDRALAFVATLPTESPGTSRAGRPPRPARGKTP